MAGRYIDEAMYEPIAAAPSRDLHCLEALPEKWMRELPDLVVTDPERAQHLVQALDDLAILIGRTKTDGQCRSRR